METLATYFPFAAGAIALAVLFAYRVFIAWLAGAVLSLFIDIVLCRFFLNWIVAAFADSDGNLPRLLRLFQTFDATLDEGMLARRRELAAGVGDSWAQYNPEPTTWCARYLNRALWLFRNSAYGFDYYLLGVRWNPDEWRVVKFINTDTLLLFFAIGGSGFNLYAHGRYGMVKIGWKAWNKYDVGSGRFSGTWGDAGKIPITISATPFKRRGM